MPHRLTRLLLSPMEAILGLRKAMKLYLAANSVNQAVGAFVPGGFVRNNSGRETTLGLRWPTHARLTVVQAPSGIRVWYHAVL